jgi:hypothetical protein
MECKAMTVSSGICVPIGANKIRHLVHFRAFPCVLVHNAS